MEVGSGQPRWQDDVQLIVEIAKPGRPRVSSGRVVVPVPPIDGTGVGSGAPPGWELDTNSAKPITITRTDDYTQVLPTSTATPLISTEYAGIRTNPPVPVVAGKVYDIGVFASDVFGAAGGHPFENPALYIDWLNSVGGTISSPATSIIARGDDPPAWRRILQRVLAPAGAVSLRIRLLGWGGRASDAYGMQLRVSQVHVHQRGTPADDADQWYDVSCDVQAVETFHGRSRFTDRFEVGTATVQLRNDDGRYSYGVVGRRLEVGRAMRISAVGGDFGFRYPLAFGYVEQAPESYDYRGHNVVNVSLRDTTSLLSAAGDPAPGVPAAGTVGELVGYRIEHLAQYVRWHDFEVGFPGTVQLQAWQRNRNLRDEAGIAADTDGGWFYADRDGVWQYVPPGWVATNTFVYATFLADDLELARGLPAIPNALTPGGDDTSDPPVIPVRTAQPDWSLARVVNEVKLARAGGTVQTYRDQASVDKYGVQSYQRTDLISTDDATFAARGDVILDALADARVRLDAVSYRPDVVGRWWDFTLDMWLMRAVRVNYRNPLSGWWMSLITRVQSIRHVIDLDSWTVELSLDEQWSPGGRFGGGTTPNFLTQVPALHAMWADDPTWERPPDGELVDSWPNVSGGGDPASTGSARPTMREEVAEYNGRAALEFAGAQRLDFDIPNIAQPFKIVAVGRLTPAGAVQQLVGRGNVNGIIGTDATNHWRIPGVSSASLADSEPHVFRLTMNGASSSLFVDGATAITGNAGTGGYLRLTVGATSDGTPTFSQFLTGDVAFVGIYAGSTPDADLQQLELDLMDYYGIV